MIHTRILTIWSLAFIAICGMSATLQAALPATRPATQSSVEELKTQLAATKAELAAAKAEIAKLKAQVAFLIKKSGAQDTSDKVLAKKKGAQADGSDFTFKSPTLGTSEKDFLAMCSDDFGQELASQNASRRVYHMYTTGDLSARDYQYLTVTVEDGVVTQIDK